MEPIILCIFFFTSQQKWVFQGLKILLEDRDKKILLHFDYDIGYYL